MNPSVTLVIPTYNGSDWLKESITDFINQEYAGEWNILVLDSQSTDGTPELFENVPNAEVHTIDRSTFGHGKTRNLAIAISDNDLLLFTVQDARPRNHLWLRDMVNALIDNKADGICGGQAVPHDKNKNPLAWYRPISECNNVSMVTPNAFNAASASERIKMCSWDNVNAIYKKTSLERVPFPDVQFAEDIAWSKMCLQLGGTIGYAHHTKVWHYHHHTPEFTRKRTLHTLYWQHQHFGVLPPLPKPPSIMGMIMAARILIFKSQVYHPLEILMWLTYNWRTGFAAFRAGQEFEAAYSKGIEEIEELRQTIVKNPPLAPKPAP